MLNVLAGKYIPFWLLHTLSYPSGSFLRLQSNPLAPTPVPASRRTHLEILQHVHKRQPILDFVPCRSNSPPISTPPKPEQEKEEETHLYSSGSSLPPAPSLAFFADEPPSTCWSGLCLPFISTAVDAGCVGMLEVMLAVWLKWTGVRHSLYTQGIATA